MITACLRGVKYNTIFELLLSLRERSIALDNPKLRCGILLTKPSFILKPNIEIIQTDVSGGRIVSSWTLFKSVLRFVGLLWVFTLFQNQRSRWAGICNQSNIPYFADKLSSFPINPGTLKLISVNWLTINVDSPEGSGLALQS